MTLDKIFLKDIELYIVVGVHSHERVREQKVRVSVTLHTNTRPASQSDALEETLNYETLKNSIEAIGKTGKFHLIETFAERVAMLCLEQTRCELTTVKVEKDWVLSHTQSVGVEIHRSRDEKLSSS